MSAKFDTEQLKMKEGQNLLDVLKKALNEKRQADRMDSDNGLFFITEVTVKSINGDEVLLEVGYEYGG
jgi:hypothetical protein